MEYYIRSLNSIMFIPYYIHTLILLRQKSKYFTATLFLNKTKNMVPYNIYYYFCMDLFLTNGFFANDVIYLVLGGFTKRVNLIPFCLTRWRQIRGFRQTFVWTDIVHTFYMEINNTQHGTYHDGGHNNQLQLRSQLIAIVISIQIKNN